MIARFMALAGSICLIWAGQAVASVEIASGPTHDISCGAGVCAPTAKAAVLNASDLANMLASSDVKIVTGSGAVAITVAAPITWTSTHRLTLDAAFNVTFRAPVVVAGPGAVTIVTNDGGSGGDLVFWGGGKLDFWDTASSLVINGSAYTLENSVPTLASAVAAHDDGFFALTSDYSLAGTKYLYHSPISNLAGTLEGLGHTIDKLLVRIRGCRTEKSIGFISKIAATGVVRNLRFDHAVVTSGSRLHHVGVLAGENAGAIANVSAKGSAGTASGLVSVCYPYGAVGGLVGENSGSIVRSKADVTVSAGNYGRRELYGSSAGGLAGGGNSVGSRIELSSATGSVTATKSSYAGGLTGSAMFISRSFATGAVSVFPPSQGTGGAQGGLSGLSADIVDSYATGPAANPCSGGLVGLAEGNVATSYALGTASAGFAGCADFGSFAADYFDTDTSQTTQGCGSGDCTGVTGLTDAQMRSGLPAGFDRAVWARKKTVNNGYPYLIDNPPQ